MHIVLVEPSGIGQKVLTQMLQGRGDRVTAFSDGARALAQVLGDDSVDVVITSFETESKSGLELCWELRLLAQAGRPIYTIAMSSSYEDSKLIEALDCGADDFIKKPPQAMELQARLRAAERLLLSQRELIHLANIDPLTELYNRRAFFEKSDELRLAARDRRSMAAIMFDIDHFKKVNDRYGHDIGDDAIRCVAQAVRTREGVAGRLGGEEFALVSSQCSRADVVELAEALRREIEAVRIETPRGLLQLTCSFGVSEWLPDEDIDVVLKRADTALYHAKNNGRNQVASFEYHVSATAKAS